MIEIVYTILNIIGCGIIFLIGIAFLLIITGVGHIFCERVDLSDDNQDH